jgi:hypothetical protein
MIDDPLLLSSFFQISLLSHFFFFLENLGRNLQIPVEEECEDTVRKESEQSKGILSRRFFWQRDEDRAEPWLNR